MDSQFRRIFYNHFLDVAPTGDLVFLDPPAAAHDRDDTLVFVGTARDNDRLGSGIVEYMWRSDLDGLLSHEQTFSIDAVDLSLGIHTISFSARDDEGNWSLEDSRQVLVASHLYGHYLPLISR
jgi:hypothetical protein